MYTTKPVPSEILDLLKKFPINDLLALLDWQYSQSSGNITKITYGKVPNSQIEIKSFTKNLAKSNHVLIIHRSKKSGEIIKAEISPYKEITFDQACINLETFLNQKLSELSTESEYNGVALLLTSKKVSGEFCCKPYFCLKEPPATAKLPPQLNADFPIVLSFKYQAPNNKFIQKSREHQTLENLKLILNLFLRDGIYRLSSQHTWGLDENFDKTLQPEFFQVDFLISRFPYSQS